MEKEDSLWTAGASPETFSVVSSENAFGGAPTGRPILAGPIPGDKMARYQKERRSESEKWRLIAGRQSGPAIIRARKRRRRSIFLVVVRDSPAACRSKSPLRSRIRLRNFPLASPCTQNIGPFVGTS